MSSRGEFHFCCTFFYLAFDHVLRVSAVGIDVNSSSAALKRTLEILFVTEFLCRMQRVLHTHTHTLFHLQLSGDVCVLYVCTVMF